MKAMLPVLIVLGALSPALTPDDQATRWLIEGVLTLLVVATMAGWILSRRVTSESGRKTVQNMNVRIRAWWFLAAIFGLALFIGRMGTIVLFAIVSFLALREFITLTPTRPGDHQALFWVFFIITPLQYILVATEWYGLAVIMIPVYAFLFIPIRVAIEGDVKGFLERTSKIQWGLMVCVYCISFAPMLLSLRIPNFEGQNARLLFWFVLVAQLSDVLQWAWGKSLGRHPIAPHVSPNKTWEGFLGGVTCAIAIGAALWWATPFTPGQAAAMATAITLMGFCGGLVMSAIKRDRGVKDYGTVIEGHGGVMDRIDSLCFAAPVFFHLTRYLFTS